MRRNNEKKEQGSCPLCGFVVSDIGNLNKHIKTHTGENYYSCRTCQKEFRSYSGYRSHEIRHRQPPTHHCDKCDKSFYEKQTLQNHQNALHNGDKVFPCKFCDRIFKHPSGLRYHEDMKHRQKEDDETKYKCDICYKSYSTKRGCAYHVKTHNSSQDVKPAAASYPCPVCGKSFLREKDMIDHARTHSNERAIECTLCDKRFKTIGGMKAHAVIHRAEKTHACSYCPLAFRRPNNLLRHTMTHTGEKPYPCPQCVKRFSSRTEVQTHSRHIHNSDPTLQFVCDVCQRGFKHLVSMRTHRLRTHGLEGDKKYSCTYCDKHFWTNAELARHVRVHTGEKAYSCSVCSKQFSTASDLGRHEPIHGDEKPFQCELCDHSTATKKNLQKHVRRMHQVPTWKYVCLICNAKFREKYELQSHAQTHSGGTLACPICKKRLRHKCLRAHLKTHTGEKPHVCQTCGRGFAYAPNLRRHLQVHS